ncbi:MAG: ATP-binding protein [Elusimicrobiota bacterium]
MLNTKIPQNLLSRNILGTLKQELDENEITLLTGSRQVGKTSLMYLLINYLINEKNIKPSQIFYFDLENIIELETMNGIKDFRKFVNLLSDSGADSNQKIWVFIDEIQYLDYPSSFLKYIYDNYKPKIKFIVSGSSSLEIKKKFTDRLTGRVHLFVIYPLDFFEYLIFSGENNLAQKKKECELNEMLITGKFEIPGWHENLGQNLLEYFELFCRFGGYPGIVLKKEPYKFQQDITNIYSFYVRKDIRDIADIDDTRGFNNLVGLIANHIGSLVSETELSSTAGISRPTVKKYLFLLENTFIIELIRPYFTNRRSEYSKMPKTFFLDPGLRNATINNFRELSYRQDTGHLAENGIFSQLTKNKKPLSEIHFWRSERGAEVDFVIVNDNVLPIEVKYQLYPDEKISTGLRSFIHRYSSEKAIVVTQNFWHKIKIEKTEVFFIPAWAI